MTAFGLVRVPRWLVVVLVVLALPSLAARALRGISRPMMLVRAGTGARAARGSGARLGIPVIARERPA